MISVIIPTYNRSDKILNILDALEQQTFKDFEVVISNDGSTDDTADVIERTQSDYSYKIILLNNPNGGRAVARNRGVAEASGEILVFYDDDVRPNTNSLKLHNRFHEEYESAILNGPALYDMKRICGDFQRFRAKMEMSWYEKLSQPVRKDRGGLVGANKSMPKQLFIEIGGFDERLTDSEDFEFSFRARHVHKVPIYMDYRAWVYHDDYKDFPAYISRRLSANSSSKRLVKLFPEILEHYPDKFVFQPKRWKKPLFKFFQAKFWINFPTTKVFRYLLPKAVRYKLYKTIITANTLYNE